MKKLVSVILVVLLLVSTTAVFAEDFSLRNGIQFGDSPETVKEKETLEYVDSSKSESMILGDWNLFHVIWGPAPYGERFSGSILGVDAGNLVFFYDDNNTLFEMLYDVDLKKDGKLYDKLLSSLTEKYGTPMDNPKGEVFFITSCVYKSKASYFTAHDEWLVPNGENFVKIELSQFVDGDDKNVYLSYTNVNASDITDQVDSYQQSMDAINGDI